MFGQKEKFMVKRAARELSRALPAQAVMVPGAGYIWNLEAPDLFTETVRAWMTDQPLPQELVVYASSKAQALARWPGFPGR